MNDYDVNALFDNTSLYYNGALRFDTPPPSATNAFTDAVSPSALDSGALEGQTILQDGYLKSSNYVAATSGWLLEPDSAEFNVGVSVDSLDIPDAVTANSFHVNTTGDAWWGAAAIGDALAKVLKTGAATFTDITATGTINATAGYAGSATALVYESTGINTGTTGHVRGGQTAYNTGTGFFLGYESAAYKFSIGNPAAEYLTWDGTNLEITAGGLTKSFIAGATINGATLPVPVYIKASDSEVYAADANASGALKFFGFAISNSTDGNSIKVRISGVVGGFTGLTVGAYYYVSDTVGTISTTPGTVQITVGVAVSATEILIVNQPIGGLVAGTNVVASANTERGPEQSGAYVKFKEIETSEGATYTVSFELKTDNGSFATFGRVYKNGAAFGTEQTTSSTSYVTFSENLAFVPGDLIQIYLKGTASGKAWTKNFRLAIGGRNPALVITD